MARLPDPPPRAAAAEHRGPFLPKIIVLSFDDAPPWSADVNPNHEYAIDSNGTAHRTDGFTTQDPCTLPIADVDALIAALVDSGILDAKPCQHCTAGAYDETCSNYSDGRFLGVSCAPSSPDSFVDNFTVLRFRHDGRVVEIQNHGWRGYRGLDGLRTRIERAVTEDCH